MRIRKWRYVGFLLLGLSTISIGAGCPFHASSWITYDQPDESYVTRYANPFDAISVYAYIFDTNDHLNRQRTTPPWCSAFCRIR